MASATSTPLSLSSSSTVIDSKASRQSAAASSRCVSLPTLPPPPIQLQSRSARTTAYCRKLARNVVAMSTGEVQAPVAEVSPPTTTTTSTTDSTDEQLEILKTIQEAWDKVDDKYAVTSVVVALTVGLWAAIGMISAIERLPLIPGVLELVGIGYSAWFAYKNVIFKPEREALIEKVKGTYKEIIGSS